MSTAELHLCPFPVVRSESKAYAKRLKNEVKGLNKRLKQVCVGRGILPQEGEQQQGVPGSCAWWARHTVRSTAGTVTALGAVQHWPLCYLNTRGTRDSS